MTYYLDNNQTNPYLKWKKLGSPDFPFPEQFQEIRDAEVQPCVCLKCCMGKILVNWLTAAKENMKSAHHDFVSPQSCASYIQTKMHLQSHRET